MKTKREMKLALAAALMVGMALSGCDSKKDPDPADNGESKEAKYALTIDAGVHPNRTSYLQGLTSLDIARVTTDNAIELAQQSIMWGYGKHIYLSFFGAPATMDKYGFGSDGRPAKLASIREPAVNTYGAVLFVSETDAYATLVGGSYKLVRFNPSTMQKTGEIDMTSIVRSDGSVPYLQGLVRRGDKLYVGIYHDKDAKPAVASAIVAIIDIASQKVEKTIEDDRTTRIYHTGFSGFGSMNLAENGDIYVQGDGFDGTPSGILRIKNGQDSFDPSYFVNLDQVTGAKCKSLLIYDGLKALTLRQEDPADEWEFNGPNYRYHKVNLETGTSGGNLGNLPIIHGPGNAFARRIDGEWLLNVSAKDQQAVYRFDPATESLSKKFDVEGRIGGLVQLK